MVVAEGPLTGRCIWYTRPLEAEGLLAARCRSLGAEVWWAPALAIAPLAADHPALAAARATLLDGAPFARVVFVSANAVRFGLPVIRAHWPQFPAGATCYAIGAATARHLLAHGIEARRPAGGRADSEALLDLPELQASAGQSVLIVRGLGGRETLAQVLRGRGARVAYLETYERGKETTHRNEANKRLAANSFDFITASSGETVENIVELIDDSLREQLLGIAIVVPGGRVESLARGAGFVRIVPAANAGDEAMTEALLDAARPSSDREVNFNNEWG